MRTHKGIAVWVLILELFAAAPRVLAAEGDSDNPYPILPEDYVNKDLVPDPFSVFFCAKDNMGFDCDYKCGTTGRSRGIGSSCAARVDEYTAAAGEELTAIAFGVAAAACGSACATASFNPGLFPGLGALCTGFGLTAAAADLFTVHEMGKKGDAVLGNLGDASGFTGSLLSMVLLRHAFDAKYMANARSQFTKAVSAGELTDGKITNSRWDIGAVCSAAVFFGISATLKAVNREKTCDMAVGSCKVIQNCYSSDPNAKCDVTGSNDILDDSSVPTATVKKNVFQVLQAAINFFSPTAAHAFERVAMSLQKRFSQIESNFDGTIKTSAASISPIMGNYVSKFNFNDTVGALEERGITVADVKEKLRTSSGGAMVVSLVPNLPSEMRATLLEADAMAKAGRLSFKKGTQTGDAAQTAELDSWVKAIDKPLLGDLSSTPIVSEAQGNLFQILSDINEGSRGRKLSSESNTDIFHGQSEDNIFEIVSQKLSCVQSRVVGK